MLTRALDDYSIVSSAQDAPPTFTLLPEYSFQHAATLLVFIKLYQTEQLCLQSALLARTKREFVFRWTRAPRLSQHSPALLAVLRSEFGSLYRRLCGLSPAAEAFIYQHRTRRSPPRSQS